MYIYMSKYIYIYLYIYICVWSCSCYSCCAWCSSRKPGSTSSELHLNRVKPPPQHAATHCKTLQNIAKHCNTLQHSATHCNTLNALHHTGIWKKCSTSHCLFTKTSSQTHCLSVSFCLSLACFQNCIFEIAFESSESRRPVRYLCLCVRAHACELLCVRVCERKRQRQMCLYMRNYVWIEGSRQPVCVQRPAFTQKSTTNNQKNPIVWCKLTRATNTNR